MKSFIVTLNISVNESRNWAHSDQPPVDLFAWRAICRIWRLSDRPRHHCQISSGRSWFLVFFYSSIMEEYMLCYGVCIGYDLRTEQRTEGQNIKERVRWLRSSANKNDLTTHAQNSPENLLHLRDAVRVRRLGFPPVILPGTEKIFHPFFSCPGLS